MPTIHGLRTPGEEIALTARPKIKTQSQIYRYGRSIFCLPHWPIFSDIFDLCLHWVSVVRAIDHARAHCSASKCYCIHTRIEPQVLGIICMVTHTLRRQRIGNGRISGKSRAATWCSRRLKFCMKTTCSFLKENKSRLDGTSLSTST